MSEETKKGEKPVLEKEIKVVKKKLTVAQKKAASLNEMSAKCAQLANTVVSLDMIKDGKVSMPHPMSEKVCEVDVDEEHISLLNERETSLEKEIKS